MTWGFLWLMLVLKIPIAALLGIVWWAIKQCDEPEIVPDPGDGGTKVPPHVPAGGTRTRFPRHRGPHDGAVLPAPPRVRTTVARAREHEHG
jgi:hypothetical protein